MMSEKSEKRRSLSPIRKHKKGQPIERNQREIILNVYKYFWEQNPEATKKLIIDEVSKCTGVGTHSLWTFLTEYENFHILKSPNKKKRRLNLIEKISEAEQNAIRRKVDELYSDGKPPVFGKVFDAVNSDPDLPDFKRTSFSFLLKKLNIKLEISRKGIPLGKRTKKETPKVLPFEVVKVESCCDSNS